MNALTLMLAPFCECLILVGIHSYLGLHVIRRKVIFVDLALAQLAALGATFGFLFGVVPGGGGAWLLSTTFCLLGAAVFALVRVRSDRVPQEAVIGLVYAITAALAILVVDKTRGEGHLEGILVGSLLWVRWSDIGVTSVLYALIGIVHYVFRRQFLLISEDPEEAWRRGLSVRLWDFLFYALFGLVITMSVRVAGVLLVFVFLVAPAILAVMISDRLRTQLVVGWVTGTVVTTVGLYLSYRMDLPSGPAVVGFYGLVLVGAAVALRIVRAPAAGRRRALLETAVGALVVVAIGLGLVAAGRRLGGHGAHHGEAHAHLQAGALPADAEAAVLDPEQRLGALREALGREEGKGLDLLSELLADDEVPPFFREEAVQLLRERAGQDFGYRVEAGRQANREALAAFDAWRRARTEAPRQIPDLATSSPR